MQMRDDKVGNKLTAYKKEGKRMMNIEVMRTKMDLCPSAKSKN